MALDWCSFVPVAWADPASDACVALANARTALYSMTLAKDKSAQDAWNVKVQAASTKLDSVLAGCRVIAHRQSLVVFFFPVVG